MNRISRVTVCWVVTVVCLAGARCSAVEPDWISLGGEAAGILRRYIQIDTTNPPGNEIEAARFLAAIFEAEGIESQIFESELGRGSILARLPGAGTRRPIVLLNHLDVVAADREQWRHPPFEGVTEGDYLYGRGATDCKGMAVVEAMAMIALKRSGRVLPFDVLFLGTADEETGGKLGAGWFVEHHIAALGDAEFVLNEGGAIRKSEPMPFVFEVAATEKTPFWLRLKTRGVPGHGSVPRGMSSVRRLIRALEKVRTYKPEIRVVPEVQAYFSALAELREEPLKTRYRNLQNSLADPGFRAEFFSRPSDAALVQSTISPTVLHSSTKTNVVPAVATAELDCRLLQDEDPDEFLAALKKVIDDDLVEIEVILNFPPVSSSLETDLYRAIEKVARAEGAAVVPNVLRGFTDSHFFRNRGMTAYGFVPVVLTDDDESRMHGPDERMPLENLSNGPKRLVAILEALAETSAGNGEGGGG